MLGPSWKTIIHGDEDLTSWPSRNRCLALRSWGKGLDQGGYQILCLGIVTNCRTTLLRSAQTRSVTECSTAHHTSSCLLSNNRGSRLVDVFVHQGLSSRQQLQPRGEERDTWWHKGSTCLVPRCSWGGSYEDIIGFRTSGNIEGPPRRKRHSCLKLKASVCRVG